MRVAQTRYKKTRFLECGYISKVELIGCADKLDVGYEKRIVCMDNTEVLALATGRTE